MLSEAELVVVKGVFNTVLGMFDYQTDETIWGKEEHWEDPAYIASQITTGKIAGDCDNFALACRFLLYKYEIHNRIAFCMTETNEGHLVCEAGGFVLDNRQTEVIPWDKLPYKWIKISGYKVGEPWKNITA